MRQFEECRRFLEEDLGAAPAAQTQQLHEAIVRGDIAPTRAQTTGSARVARRLLGSADPPAMRGRRETSALLEEFTSVVDLMQARGTSWGRFQLESILARTGEVEKFTRKSAAAVSKQEFELVKSGFCEEEAGR